jgi:hypothetical protein
MMGNESKDHRKDATCIQSSAERETNPAVVVVWREGEAIRQKGQFGARTVWSR